MVREGVSDGGDVGAAVGKSVGCCDGIDENMLGIEDGASEIKVGESVGKKEGIVLGRVLGLSDGTALAQVSQQFLITLPYEQRVAGSSLAAHSQVASIPSSRTLNDPSPAASPTQAEQHD